MILTTCNIVQTLEKHDNVMCCERMLVLPTGSIYIMYYYTCFRLLCMPKLSLVF